MIVGLALAGCNKSTRQATTSADTNRDYTAATPTTADKMAQDVRSGVNAASSAISNAAGSVATTARMTEWKLNASDIQADLDAKREIVRTKTTTGTPAASMDKSTLKAAVEGRIKADSELAGFKVDVDPGSNGEINLDGEVNNAALVGKAIALALDTDGVNKVKSKIKVDAKARADRR